MNIVLFFGVEWARYLIDPIVTSGHNVKGITFLIPKSYAVRFKISVIRKTLFRISLFLKLRFNFRSNKLYAAVTRFKVPIIITESTNSPSFRHLLERKHVNLILVAGWEERLSSTLINFPRYGCINCHPSLLPKFRGPNPFYWIIINDEQETGFTFHYIDLGIDTGDIILKDKVSIDINDTAGSLAEKCAKLAGRNVRSVLNSIANGSVKRIAQGKDRESYYKNVEDQFLDLNKSAADICRCFRASTPFVKTYIISNNRKILVGEPRIIKRDLGKKESEIGDIISMKKNRLLVGCQDHNLLFESYKVL